MKIGDIVKITVPGFWPTFHTCTCKESDSYHLLDSDKKPRWCYVLSELDATGFRHVYVQVDKDHGPYGLVVDRVYWRKQALWLVLANEALICADEEHLESLPDK